MMTAGLVKHVWWMLNDANFHHDQQVKIQILSIYLKWCTLYTRWKSHSTCQQAIPKGNLIFQTSIIRVKVLVTLFFYVTSVNIFWWNVFSQNMMWNAITHTHTNTQSLRGWMSRVWPRTMPSRQGGKIGVLGGSNNASLWSFLRIFCF